jgi:hypothetical protein
MNSNASNTTFCETWVVESIVVTHFRKPVVGIASAASGFNGEGDEGTRDSATF